jgi:hypothetical protein
MVFVARLGPNRLGGLFLHPEEQRTTEHQNERDVCEGALKDAGAPNDLFGLRSDLGGHFAIERGEFEQGFFAG